MAEEEVTQEIDSDEAEELEKLLETEKPAKENEAEKVSTNKNIFEKLKSNKKLAIILIGIFILVIGLGVGGYYMYFLEEEISLEEVTAEVNSDLEPDEAKSETEKGLIEVPNLFHLKPFFLPIKEKDQETGHFMHVTVNLLLSNKKLDKDIEKILPLIRQNIYSILKRKRRKDLKNQPSKLEEILKREIITASNSLLLSGTGTVSDVYFSEFIISQS